MSVSLKVLSFADDRTAQKPAADSVLLTFQRPGRAEIVVQDGKLLVHLYEGAEIDMGQVPTISYEPEHTDLSVGESVTK